MKRLRQTALRAAGAAALCVLAGWVALPKTPLLEGVSFSRRVFDRNGTLLRLTLASDEKYRIRTPLAEVPAHMIDATLRYEDRHFFRHLGVNPVALIRAAGCFALGRPRGGASTITMQVARLRYGIDSRAPIGKLRQIFCALAIERHYRKREILEAYFNLAPYGGNIEGLGAACEILWRKASADLTLPEAITLSVLPQNPGRRRLHVRNPRGSGASARSRLAQALGAPAELNSFIPSAEERRRWRAPHFTTQVLRENPGTEHVASTLDLPLQEAVEKAIARHMASLANAGVRNAAALLVDARTMEVLAQAGSADFFDHTIGGQVDGTRSRRSPGSTLKPFIYALAMDQGLIHPGSILKDAPQSFGGYNPENFERDFAGPIRASEALARSRNVPAVALAAELRRPTLYAALRKARVGLSEDEGHYGLALALGGAELTMEELVRMYGALANGGRMRELARVGRKPAAASVRLWSEEAAFLTLEMLAEERGVFAKTGTSHGMRDAWCIGVFDSFITAVWVGNFDGSRNAALIGRTAAAPLLREIVESVRQRRPCVGRKPSPPPGANLRAVEICPVSGGFPNRTCPHRTSSWIIPGVSPIGECEVHREVFVEAATGLRIAHAETGQPVRREVYEFWPTDLLELFRQAGVPRRIAPPFAAHRGVGMPGRPPRITSPGGSARYRFRAAESARALLNLCAQTESDVRKVYWFSGRDFIGSSAPREVLRWRPSGSDLRLVALDDQGRSSSCRVTVEWTE